MATSEAKEIKKQEILVRFSIISYKTRLRVYRISANSFRESVMPLVGGQGELEFGSSVNLITIIWAPLGLLRPIDPEVPATIMITRNLVL